MWSAPKQGRARAVGEADGRLGQDAAARCLGDQMGDC